MSALVLQYVAIVWAMAGQPGYASCEALAVCTPTGCEAFVLSCTAPLDLGTCLTEAHAYLPGSEEMATILGCSPDARTLVLDATPADFEVPE